MSPSHPAHFSLPSESLWAASLWGWEDEAPSPAVLGCRDHTCLPEKTFQDGDALTTDLGAPGEKQVGFLLPQHKMAMLMYFPI